MHTHCLPLLLPTASMAGVGPGALRTRHSVPVQCLGMGTGCLHPHPATSRLLPLPQQLLEGFAEVMVGEALEAPHPGPQLTCLSSPVFLQPSSLCEDERAALRPRVAVPPSHTVWLPWRTPQAGHLCCPSGTPPWHSPPMKWRPLGWPPFIPQASSKLSQGFGVHAELTVAMSALASVILLYSC